MKVTFIDKGIDKGGYKATQDGVNAYGVTRSEAVKYLIYKLLPKSKAQN